MGSNEPVRLPAEQQVMHATVVTAFTSNYELGHLTSPANRAYAERHGYAFHCRIRPPFNWHAPGSRHPSWDKVAILLDLLDDALDRPLANSPTHILWVDADAVIVRQEVSLDDLWQGLPVSCELLIGEDIAPVCHVNAGVFVVRVSEWSRKLWREVWDADAGARFHTRLYWEQSVLQLVLRQQGEGLERVKPFHSYAGGPPGVKMFPHVCVLPRQLFNTNRGELYEAGEFGKQQRCGFVFHAAGHPTMTVGPGTTWRPSKKQAICAMLIANDLGAFSIDNVVDIRSICRKPRGPPRLQRPTESMRRHGCRYPGRIAN